MGAYKITDWNEDIIQPINELCENPDPGCEALEPLEEVEDPHIWAVSDIEDAQDKLKEICDENEFAVELKLWKQEIIDELKEAIEEGWCNCCEDEETTTTLLTATSRRYCTQHVEICTTSWMCDKSEMPESPGSLCDSNYTHNEFLRDTIDDLQVGVETDIAGTWKVYKNETSGVTGLTTSTLIATGEVDTDGIAHYTGTARLQIDLIDGSVYRTWTCTCTEGTGWPGWCCLAWETEETEEETSAPVGDSLDYSLVVTQCIPDA